MSITVNRKLLSTANVGESVPKDEMLSGVAVDLKGPVTQEAVDILQKIMSTLESGNPFDDPTPSDGQDGQASSKATIFHLVTC